MKGKISLISIFLYFLVRKETNFRSFFVVTVTVTTVPLFLGSYFGHDTSPDYLRYFVTQKVTRYSNAVTCNALLQCPGLVSGDVVDSVTKPCDKSQLL